MRLRLKSALRGLELDCWYEVAPPKDSSVIQYLMTTLCNDLDVPFAQSDLILEVEGFDLLPRSRISGVLRDGDIVTLKQKEVKSESPEGEGLDEVENQLAPFSMPITSRSHRSGDRRTTKRLRDRSSWDSDYEDSSFAHRHHRSTSPAEHDRSRSRRMRTGSTGSRGHIQDDLKAHLERLEAMHKKLENDHLELKTKLEELAEQDSHWAVETGRLHRLHERLSERVAKLDVAVHQTTFVVDGLHNRFVDYGRLYEVEENYDTLEDRVILAETELRELSKHPRITPWQQHVDAGKDANGILETHKVLPQGSEAPQAPLTSGIDTMVALPLDAKMGSGRKSSSVSTTSHSSSISISSQSSSQIHRSLSPVDLVASDHDQSSSSPSPSSSSSLSSSSSDTSSESSSLEQLSSKPNPVTSSQNTLESLNVKAAIGVPFEGNQRTTTRNSRKRRQLTLQRLVKAKKLPKGSDFKTLEKYQTAYAQQDLSTLTNLELQAVQDRTEDEEEEEEANTSWNYPDEPEEGWERRLIVKEVECEAIPNERIIPVKQFEESERLKKRKKTQFPEVNHKWQHFEDEGNEDVILEADMYGDGDGNTVIVTNGMAPVLPVETNDMSEDGEIEDEASREEKEVYRLLYWHRQAGVDLPVTTFDTEAGRAQATMDRKDLKPGQIISFRSLEMRNFCPTISEYKVGQIVRVGNDHIEMQLAKRDTDEPMFDYEGNRVPGYFDVQDEDEQIIEGRIAISTSELMEVLLIKDRDDLITTKDSSGKTIYTF